jgi:hypothetical protein
MRSSGRPCEYASTTRAAAIWSAWRAGRHLPKRRAGLELGQAPQNQPRHYAFGTREQWVYGGGYLYFTDGVLTAISTRE